MAYTRMDKCGDRESSGFVSEKCDVDDAESIELIEKGAHAQPVGKESFTSACMILAGGCRLIRLKDAHA